ncbi:hypothetical protein D3C78_1813480 [compost metagenome]
MQARSRSGEMQLLGNGDETAKVAQFHARSSFPVSVVGFGFRLSGPGLRTTKVDGLQQGTEGGDSAGSDGQRPGG